MLNADGASRYGDNTILLNRSSEDSAWISFFVMYPNDITLYARSQAIEDLSQGAFKTASLPESPGDGFKSFPELEKARQQLNHFDFTASDFEGLLKDSLLVYLADLKTTNPTQYEQALKTIQTGSSMDVTTLVNQAFTKKVGLPDWDPRGLGSLPFEGKVPGFITKEDFSVQSLNKSK